MPDLFAEPKRAAFALVLGVLLTAALLYLWWPGGTLVGTLAGVAAVLQIGTAMQRAADEQVAGQVVGHEQAADDGVRAELERLKADLGDDYPDFARAARLVVSTQYASAARLQRDLQVPYSRARRLLTGLEQQHFVGPATGTLPRQVLLPKERLPEVERLFADA
jgi:DNA segregation ATPase FtsK/SpoIIIE-like protein